MERVSTIACGYKDAIYLDRLWHDPLMKLRGRPPCDSAPDYRLVNAALLM
jgi:hypothetical protein